jgi:hypothetical protein
VQALKFSSPHCDFTLYLVGKASLYRTWRIQQIRDRAPSSSVDGEYGFSGSNSVAVSSRYGTYSGIAEIMIARSRDSAIIPRCCRAEIVVCIRSMSQLKFEVITCAR